MCGTKPSVDWWANRLVSSRTARSGSPRCDPAHRVEARVPEPLPRVHRGVGNAEARLAPVGPQHRRAGPLGDRAGDGAVVAVRRYRGGAHDAASTMSTCAFVSFRLGLTDGVSIVADSWARAMRGFGFDVCTVAGEGPVDRVGEEPRHRRARRRGIDVDVDEIRAALDDADLVVVENLCTIPLNLPAARAVAAVLAGRPAILHHHDPPWQRAEWAHVTELPPDDPAWRHVTINDLTRRQFADRGLSATTIYNGFDAWPDGGDRDADPRPARRRRRRPGWSCTRCGPSPARTSPPRSASARRSTPPTGCSVRPSSATPRRARPRAGRGESCPGHPRTAPARTRHLRGRRRRRLPVDVGGIRQPARRGVDGPPARRRRAPTPSAPSSGRSGSSGSTPPIPSPCGPGSPRPTRRCSTATRRWPGPASPSRPWPRALRGLLLADAGWRP